MSGILSNLKPKRLWELFEEICEYPRPSKKEEAIAKYIVDFGTNLGLKVEKDDVGNILITKGAQKGYENMKSVVLQSHIDMVCEKNSDTVHDFEKDPIVPFIDGDWVRAKGTTLGADDGIGIAAQLAILESKDIAHGPIECLFTVDEETGLTGAFGLKEGFVKSRLLLNLDSEDEGELFIGCAGGKDTQIAFKFKKEEPTKELTAYNINVSGLKGGHSGDEINKELGNSIKILARILKTLSGKVEYRIGDLQGGNLRNAIPREATATILIKNENYRDLKDFVDDALKTFQNELSYTDPNLKVLVSECKMPDFVIDKETQAKIVHALYICPNGVMHMTPNIPGLVESSTNLATLKIEEDKVRVGTSQRSSVESRKELIADIVASSFKAFGAETFHSDGYPGWQPNLDSEILKVAKDSYVKLFNKEPKVLAIHAGLECGLIGEKYPGIDMISFGPTIKGAHSPDEGILIDTASKFWEHLLDILKNIPKA